MNKNNTGVSESDRLAIDYSGYLKLGQFWNKIQLSGQFWRFYYHESRGAGVYANGKSIELRPDHCYILPPHGGLTTWCNGTPHQLYIHFDTTISSGNPRFPVLAIPLTPELREMITMLKNTMVTPEKNSLHTSLIAIALCARALNFLPAEALPELEKDHRLEIACDYLRDHLAQPVNLKALALKVKMTPGILSKLFRENTGTTPYQYLLQLRYNHASKLLRSSPYSIDEIAELVGIKDRFHFSRTFKKIYGVPPAQYRSSYALKTE